MNKRLQKLAEQAGWDLWEGRAQRDMTGCDTELQKFAELIVRDCALTAGLMEHEGRNGIGAQLLDNFGIAE